MAYTERQREYQRNKWRETAKHANYSHLIPPPAPKVDEATLRVRMAEIPEDTRNLTALLMGDPLPGRRAIDHRRHA